MSEIKDENLEEEYENLKRSKLKQQKLPAWRPVPTITSTTITFISFGVVFITIGIIILIYSNTIEEYSIRYDNLDNCNDNIKICNITIKINKKMKQPVMVYYQLNKFYQNHRRYVKSKSDKQLNGKSFSLKEMKNSGDCAPAETNSEMNKIFVYNSTTELNPDDLAIPCGLIAKSFFDDDYALYKNNGDSEENRIEIDEKDIAWQADKDIKYKNTKEFDKQWMDMTNEHFIVWMRPAGLPNFRKLWGRIREDLEVGNYLLEIKNNYQVSDFNGEKKFVISTVNAFGGKNNFLGLSYVIVGGICLILAVIFVIGYNFHQKKEK